METLTNALAQRRIVVGVGGGIAAYKIAELVRLLRKAGATVHVVMTAAAQEFITPLTLQTLSGNPVGTALFDLGQESQIGHIALADAAELLLIAPATADLLARLALGLGNDLLTTLALACRAPLLVAPAMNVNMWQHAAVRANVEVLAQRGTAFVGPEPGELACGWIGEGRMSEPAAIVEKAAQLLQTTAQPGPRDLVGRRVLITAGPTYEAIDPVRFIGNRSSGKMGFALAREAARRGASVTLVAGPVSLPTPPGVRRIDVESAEQMAAAVLPALPAEPASEIAALPDVIIMSAAVADYRPSTAAPAKLKKERLGAAPQLALSPTVDILAELGRRRGGRPHPVLVGFAAETDALESNAEAKLRRKGCDLIVGNDVSEPGSGFGTDTNRVTLLSWAPRSHDTEASAANVTEVSQSKILVERIEQLPKDQVAALVWDRVCGLLHGMLDSAGKRRDSASESKSIS